MSNLHVIESHPGSVLLMAQVTRAWETDGGAVLSRGAVPPADAEADLVVEVVAVPGAARREIVLRGELDVATVPQLRAAVAAACRPDVGRARAAVLALDLTAVTFMDSAALHALADIDALVVRRGWSLRVTPPAARGPRRLLLLAARRRWLPRWRTGMWRVVRRP